MKHFIFLSLNWMMASFASAIATQAQEDIHYEEKSSKMLKETAIWGITEDQLDSLFENSTDYVAMGGACYFHRINKKWTKTLGWTVEEWLSTPFMDFIHPEDILSSHDAASRANNVACLINYKNRYRSKQGDYHWIEWFSLFQISGTNRNSPWLAVAKDLTLEKQLEEERSALQQAEAAARLKSSFVAHMSHEIRTPLNGVMGFLNLALEEEMSENVRSYVQNAHESSQFLLDVANDIIDVSKIEANALKIESVNFNPFTAVKSVVSLLDLQARKKSIVLKSQVDPDLPPVLKGDENRFKQILINLVGNAVKFTAQGKVSLKVEGRSQGGIPPTFVLQGRIKDTGIGIEPDFISHLFKPFSQEDHSMRRQFGGAGLGLYITKQLCERMGGSINVMSTPGVGTTFQFHVIVGQPPLRSPNLMMKRRSSKAPVIKTLPPSKILLVEDNLMNQKVVTILLQKLGCEVDIAENGQKGLEAVRQKAYDLVLMDGEMPVMDGLQSTREIRKQFSSQQLPIIGLSAHAMSTHQDQFLEAGMNGYLTKPIHKEVLAQEMIRCLQGVSPNSSSSL